MTDDTNKPDSTKQVEKLVSINEAPPDDLGGIYARQGFAYQDDVAASYLIEMLINEDLVEVRCESNEDITQIWSKKGSRVVEFVQVKAEHPDQLWTIPKLTERTKSKEHPQGIGTSILEKNLSWDKYDERSIFKIVTCRQVNKDLALLTHPLDNDLRDEGNSKFQELKKSIGKKIGNFTSKKDNGADYWTSNAMWSVIDEKLIIDLNKHNLTVNLHLLGFQTDPEIISELYDVIRALAKNKAEIGIEDWKNKKITKSDFLYYIKKHIDPYPGSNKSYKLEGKIIGPGMDQTCYEVAKEQQRYYLMKKRTSQYFSSDESSDIDINILHTLHRLRSSLDSGEISDSPAVFHNTCLKEVEKIGNQTVTNPGVVSDAYFTGCMYEITSRCRHRFTKAGK